MAADFGRTDLHLHSTVSDGTDSPEALAAIAKAAGLGLFSLTDHDSFKGCEIILARRAPGDPAFLTGAEFSCRDEKGKYHILGYGFDPAAAPIRAVTDHGHALRMKKVCARLDFLAERFGFTFSDEDRAQLLAQDNPGKPHIGNLMVRYGYAGSITESIRDYMDQLHFPSEYIRPEEAIEGILASGGIPVLAHPCYGSGDELILGAELEGRVRRLMEFGLRGLEGCYSGYTGKLRAQMLALADRCGLLVTAGSDYHGSNKMVVLGDTGLEAAPSGILDAFLDEVGDRICGAP